MRVTWWSYEYYTDPTFLLFSRTMSMDYTKPLLVPAGSDALGQIGTYMYVGCSCYCRNSGLIG